ncbi:hypothetical protein NDU88_006260 [Pleurodeles waltl]|uniref:Uncharacterized protein n=1 Tax=Pleurodeles waltl TaxID=8319 RepID=A0AAV7WC01_PLEWA|nr:hypothetical protein NDU88_006260 [Pleurodeles waltl]
MGGGGVSTVRTQFQAEEANLLTGKHLEHDVPHHLTGRLPILAFLVTQCAVALRSHPAAQALFGWQILPRQMSECQSTISATCMPWAGCVALVFELWNWKLGLQQSCRKGRIRVAGQGILLGVRRLPRCWIQECDCKTGRQMPDMTRMPQRLGDLRKHHKRGHDRNATRGKYKQ